MEAKKNSKKASPKATKETKTTPAARKTDGDEKKKEKTSTALITTATKKAAASTAKKSTIDAPKMVFTTEATRRILLAEFKRQGRPGILLNPDYVEAVRRHLTAKVHRHVRHTKALSLYKGLESTDARAFDLLTLIEFGFEDAIDSIIYAKEYNNKTTITDALRKQPLLLLEAPKPADK